MTAEPLGALDLARSQPPPQAFGAAELRLVPPLPMDLAERALVRRAQRFVQAVVEVIEGNRSPTQLLRCTSPRVYDHIRRRMRLRARQQPARDAIRSARARVVSVRVTQPREGVAEVAARVQHGVRSHALAVRLELREQSWICTAIEWG